MAWWEFYWAQVFLCTGFQSQSRDVILPWYPVLYCSGCFYQLSRLHFRIISIACYGSVSFSFWVFPSGWRDLPYPDNATNSQKRRSDDWFVLNVYKHSSFDLIWNNSNGQTHIQIPHTWSLLLVHYELASPPPVQSCLPHFLQVLFAILERDKTSTPNLCIGISS